MTRRLPALLAFAGLAVLPSVARAQRCERPIVMLTVDRSSSMLGRLPEGITKWDAAEMAIAELTSAYEGRIDFGLQPFPYPNRCEPGRVVLEPGPHSSAEIVRLLGGPPPSSGLWTPMAQTLDAAAAHPSMRDASRTRHLVLVTDGWQWCDPYDPRTRFLPVESVRRLRELGVTVHVVGFGSAVDPLTLNRAAVAAGTALPGCDPTLEDPMAPNHCYSQANNLAELRMALGEIARLVTEELCNGLDDDCDGTIDEGYDVDADGFTLCGSVPGGGTDPRRQDCDDHDALVHPGAAEICDGRDNDCDGAVDPGCDCIDGEERACGTEIGACTPGIQRCEHGVWQGCEGGVTPRPGETCDGTDEDCDGAIDEDADASCGEGRACTVDGCIDILPDPPDVPAEPPEESLYSGRDGMQDGCACQAAGAGAAMDPEIPVAFLAMLLTLVALRSRRRRCA
jgi:MYXO-CTERM domain-containing protein